MEKRSTRGISGTTYVPTQRGIPSIPVLRDDRTHTKMKADLSAAIYRVWFFGLQRCPVVTFPFHYYRLPGCVYGVLQSVLATAEFLSISNLQRLPRSRQISGSISIPSSELQTQLRHNLRLRQIVPCSRCLRPWMSSRFRTCDTCRARTQHQPFQQNWWKCCPHCSASLLSKERALWCYLNGRRRVPRLPSYPEVF